MLVEQQEPVVGTVLDSATGRPVLTRLPLVVVPLVVVPLVVV